MYAQNQQSQQKIVCNSVEVKNVKTTGNKAKMNNGLQICDLKYLKKLLFIAYIKSANTHKIILEFTVSKYVTGCMFNNAGK